MIRLNLNLSPQSQIRTSYTMANAPGGGANELQKIEYFTLSKN